ncbi:unnamed protein product, partial [Candidula unifasciata]
SPQTQLTDMFTKWMIILTVLGIGIGLSRVNCCILNKSDCKGFDEVCEFHCCGPENVCVTVRMDGNKAIKKCTKKG